MVINGISLIRLRCDDKYYTTAFVLLRVKKIELLFSSVPGWSTRPMDIVDWLLCAPTARLECQIGILTE